MQIKTERFEARLSVEQKNTFAKAASLQGVSLTDFILGSAEQAAKQTLQEEDVLNLTLRDRMAFVEALQDDSPPHPKRQKAAKRYKKALGIS